MPEHPSQFDILGYRTVFQEPAHLTDVESWQEHMPFGFFCVEALAPRVLVELGTHKGDSYCAFLQAVQTSGFQTRCYAVDTWNGDEHTGPYDDEVLAELRRYHDPLYGSFSTLIRATFDEALVGMEDGSVDLLHLDGCHTYEAVCHDFQSWLPKISNRGVVLFHDTSVRERDFGVWRLWDEIAGAYPSFAFTHGHGLGVLAVGSEVDETFLGFLAEAGERVTIAELFHALGNRIKLLGMERRLMADLTSTREALAEHEAAVASLQQELAAVEGELVGARSRIEQHGVAEARLAEYESALNAAYGSLSWRITSPLRGTKDLLRRSRVARGAHARMRNARDGSRKPSTKLRPRGRPTALVDRTYLPLVSIVMPVFNTDQRFLKQAVRSVLRQSYSNWELCICDDGSTDRATTSALEEIEKLDPRIRITAASSNGGIAAATNRALELAAGEFVAFLDHDDELEGEALDEFVTLLNRRPDTDAIYSDEDKIDSRGRPGEPHFKPAWSPEFFRGVMYVGHLLMIRRSTIEKVGGLDPAFDGVQDYELMLRVAEQTDRIEHLSKVLYHWRAIPTSVAFDGNAKAGISELQAQAVNADLEHRTVPAIARPSLALPHRVEIHPTPRENWPSVSIVIPTKDAPETIGPCLESIFAQTSYPNFEVVIVDNGTTDPSALAILESHNVHVVALDGRFNFSRANNIGVSAASGDHVILLNNDTEVLRPDWIETLVWHVELPGVGAVGPLLVYQDGSVQHAGVVLGPRGTADHAMFGFRSDTDGYAGSLSCTREVSAVTAACMIVPRELFRSLGGLKEDFRTHYQDVDFCLRLRDGGHSVLFTPRTRLLHHQGVSRGEFYDHLDRALLLDVWGDVIARGDPYYNRNLSLDPPDYSFAS